MPWLVWDAVSTTCCGLVKPSACMEAPQTIMNAPLPRTLALLLTHHSPLSQPSFVIPTAVGFPSQHGTIQQSFTSCAASTSGGMRYCVGGDAVLGASCLDVVSPLKAGLVRRMRISYSASTLLWVVCICICLYVCICMYCLCVFACTWTFVCIKCLQGLVWWCMHVH